MPETNENDADPQASTSKYQTDAEFVPVGCDEVYRRSPQSSTEASAEKDPLLEENRSELLTIAQIKSEPASEDEEPIESVSVGNKYLDEQLARPHLPKNSTLVSTIE